MSSRFHSTFKLLKVLLMAGLLTWGVFAWWHLRQARRAGAVLAGALKTTWPEDGAPQFGTRERLLAAAENVRNGDFRAVVAGWGPVESPSEEQQAAAQRFFAKAPEMRARFIAATGAAQVLERDGADVSPVRDALARALVAATENDLHTAGNQIQFAEAALDALDIGDAAALSGSGPAAVTEWLREIEPAFKLGEDLMTEGHAAADKLVRRARRHFQAGEFKRAAALIRLAADLLAVELPAPAGTNTPKWFDALGEAPAEDAGEARAVAAVELCEAMAMSTSPAKPVKTLIRKARRELDAGRLAEAFWWSSVALNALGMTDEAIATATETVEEETSP